MEFIDFEATEEFNQQNKDLIFSDDENNDGKVAGNFMDDAKEFDNSEPSFYRKFDNQVKDPRVDIYEESDDEDFSDTRDMQPELYAIEDREKVIFDEFSGYEKSVEKFKKSLASFSDSDRENSFFDAVIYGLMSNLTEKNITKDKVESVLGEEFYKVFCESKESLKLDTSIFVSFNKCALVNDLLTTTKFFSKVLREKR